MKRKNLLVLLLALVFMWSITMAGGVAASTTTVYVSPPEIRDPTLIPGTQFTIDIAVANVENLRGYQFEMTFNPDVLNGVGVEVGPFLGSAGGTVLPVPGQGFDNTAGTLSLTGAILQEKTTALCPDGNGVLATVTFEVVGYGGSSLEFGANTGLWGPDGEWIIRGLENVRDGYFANDKIHDVSVTSIVCTPDSVYQGEPIFITVVVENLGEFTETFDVKVFAVHWGTGEYVYIGTQTVDALEPGESTSLSFVWDTTDARVGTYQVYAEAVGVQGESGQTKNNIVGTTFGGISVPANEATLLEQILTAITLAVRLLPMVLVGVIAVVFFRSLMSIKTRWPIRLLKR